MSVPKRFRRTATVGIVILLMSVAPLALAQQHAALIYVYSLWEAPHRSAVPIYCDGALVAKVKRGYFFVISVSPGQHELERKGGVPLIVDAHANEDSFVSPGEVIQLTPSGKTSIPTLQLTPAFVAKRALIHLGYIDAKEIYSKSVLHEDPESVATPQFSKRSDSH